MDLSVPRASIVYAIATTMGALLCALPSQALPASPSLEEQAQTEFAKAGAAVRERFEKEAAGDLIGARIAAQEAEQHRYRFLDLQRELARHRPKALAAPSVAASRDPFVPDRAIAVRPSHSAPPESASNSARAERETVDSIRPWDMYRSRATEESAHSETREPPDSVPAPLPARRIDMYAKPAAAGATVEALGPASNLSAAPPQAPFLVYRERVLPEGSRVPLGAAISSSAAQTNERIF